MKKCGTLDWVALILVVLGAINWGLVGAFNIDLVKMFLGDMTVVSKTVYIVIGLAGVYKLVSAFRCCAKST